MDTGNEKWNIVGICTDIDIYIYIHIMYIILYDQSNMGIDMIHKS